jgi:hypothetical protein
LFKEELYGFMQPDVIKVVKLWSVRWEEYSSPNIIRMIKSRRLRWTGHVARMGERRCAYRALVGKPEGRGPLGRPRLR